MEKPEKRLKILCLHGYRQNSQKFYSQTGALRKILKNYADFSFISAPHSIPESEKPDKEKEDDQRGWWFTKKTSFNSRDETDDDYGFQESLKAIEEHCKLNGPFDGILGFSQGASLVALLCVLKSIGEFSADFKFVIMVSGFKSLCSKHLDYYNRLIDVPSLHVIGETDRIIDKEMSEKLTKVFVNPVILRHSGGHFVPGISSLKKDYVDFIKAQLN